MRNIYYKILIEKNLIDTLKKVVELSYSQKIKIINNLLLKYDSRLVNLALLDYDENYIQQNRVNLKRLKNTLIFFCKKNNEK